MRYTIRRLRRENREMKMAMMAMCQRCPYSRAKHICATKENGGKCEVFKFTKGGNAK